jgi:hypothetical protein
LPPLANKAGRGGVGGWRVWLGSRWRDCGRFRRCQVPGSYLSSFSLCLHEDGCMSFEPQVVTVGGANSPETPDPDARDRALGMHAARFRQLQQTQRSSLGGCHKWMHTCIVLHVVIRVPRHGAPVDSRTISRCRSEGSGTPAAQNLSFDFVFWMFSRTAVGTPAPLGISRKGGRKLTGCPEVGHRERRSLHVQLNRAFKTSTSVAPRSATTLKMRWKSAWHDAPNRLR